MTESKEFKILQWNIRGIKKNSGYLQLKLEKDKVDLALIQEGSINYKKDKGKEEIDDYELYQDDYIKTSIYINANIDHKHIEKKVKKGLYFTFVEVNLKDENDIKKRILFGSIYRPPNSKKKSSKIFKIIEDIKKDYLREGKLFDKIIIGGDLNSSHKKWGGGYHNWKRRNENKYKDGVDLVNKSAEANFEIQNNGQPTRFWRDKKTKELKFSRIDLTLTEGIKSNELQWKVDETDRRSDHYQINMKWQINFKRREIHQFREGIDIKYRWKIINDAACWNNMNIILEEEWKKFKEDKEKLFKSDLKKEEKGDILVSKIIDIYREAAAENFEIDENKRIWKRWISKKAQAIAIKYHRYYRRIKNLQKKRSIKRKEWRKLKKLRRERNKVIRGYRIDYFEKKFKEENIDGKEGWKVAAEVRDLNHNQYKLSPDFINEKGETIARKIGEKAKLLEEHYHRFDNLAELESNLYYTKEEKFIEAQEERSQEIKLIRDVREIEQKEKMEKDKEYRNLLPSIKLSEEEEEMQQEGNIITEKVKHIKLWNKFKKWMKNSNKKKWKKASQYHKRQLEKLNSEITKEEVSRAIQSFDSTRAYGPDYMHIKFFKNCRKISIEILTELFNKLYIEWNHIPEILKTRWIIPILKPGKSGKSQKDYRPISLTSYIMKILEKILCYRFVSYLVILRLISPVHFGYMMGRNTQDCITYLVDRILRNMNKNKQTDAIFYDFSAAFDCVRINILMWKIETEYFITGYFRIFIEQYLNGRYSCIIFEGFRTEWKKDIIGVPQGGSLSPIFFIVYIDNLSLINNMKGIRMGIFADDLSVYIDNKDRKISIPALQESILMVQWYSVYHGLNLNLDKTKLKTFKKKGKKSKRNNLYMIINPLENIKDNPRSILRKDQIKILIEEEKPVKYLGIYLDTNLNLKFHIEKIIEKCMKRFHVINHNLKKLWQIKANIAWTIFQCCIITIIDYSSILFPLINKGEIKKLEKIYNKMLGWVFSPIAGTPKKTIYQQMDILGFEKRWKCRVAQYFTHLIRSPRSGILFKEIEKEWWDMIRYRITRRQNKNYDKMIKKRHKYEELKNTLIWKIQSQAMEVEYSDLEYIKKHTEFHQIEKEISYYIDLTADNIKYSIKELEGKFEEREEENEKEELLVFTDGSVKKNIGGYGYHMIRRKEYEEIKKLDLKQYKKRAKDKNWHENWMWLSRRCSIEYCEIMAIRDVIRDIATFLRKGKKQKITSVRIISDSETCIRWITGRYVIKSATIKELVEEIRWDANIIMEENDIQIKIQWVKAHAGTKGNEIADQLAEKGRKETKKDKRFNNYENWKYISRRAISNEVEENYRKKLKLELKEALKKSEFGELLKGKKWTRKFKKEMRALNRREIRILLGIRNGHNYLRKYLVKRLGKKIDIKCRCGKKEEDAKHLWEDCTHTETLNLRQEAKDNLKRIYELEKKRLEEKADEKNISWDNRWWHDERIDFNNIRQILYPNTKHEREYKESYLKVIIYFFKIFEDINKERIYRKGKG